MDQLNLVVTTRRALAQDAKPIEALETRAFASDRLSARSLRDYLKSPAATVLVAEDEAGNLLGYAIVRFRRATSVARLYSIAVAEGARGHGVGEQLLTAAEEEARRRGDLFMRLEVRADNASAIALYDRLGYRAFGRHLDYYEDHAEAIRLEKRIIGRAPANAREVPYYAQTTDFTCGPAAMMTAMAAAGFEISFSRRLEFELWREANGIYLATAPGGCDPFGIAVALARRGLKVGIHVNHPGPYFTAGQRQARSREIMKAVQAVFRDEAAERNIPVHDAPLSRDGLMAALDRGAVAIMLISTYRMYRTRVPHWIVAYDHDPDYIFAHDPFVDIDEFEAPMDKSALAIPLEEFDVITAFGTDRLRAAIVVEPHTPT
ncbi:MAG TPA: peptidase C39 family protein [Aestuariivirgaceae bacterium]|nr:peptidase C39 family protein [Aestuariivirgaceae bacterium]